MSDYELREVFDISKFTVTGSPTITTDGIASGFSASNYLTIPTTFMSGNSWKIKAPISASLTNHATIVAVVGTNCMQIVYNPSTKVVNYSFSSNGSSWDIANSSFTATNLDATKDSMCIVEFTGTSYKIDIVQNGINVGSLTPISSTSKLYQASTPLIVLGNNRALNSNAFNGSIDLKQFSIIVDGVEVFKGTKTIVAKIPPARVEGGNLEVKSVYNPDAFTVVGSPTITNDGIASGFTSSDKLEGALISLSSAKSFTVKCRIRTPKSNETPSVNTYWMLSSNCYLSAYNSSKLAVINTSGTKSTGWSFSYLANTIYDVEYSVDIINNTQSITFKDIVNNTTSTYTSANEFTWADSTFYIGNWSGSSHPMSFGSIDLKQFSITVDGQEVFSGSKLAEVHVPLVPMDYNAALKELQDYYANLLIIQYHNKPKAIALIKNLVKYLYADMMLFKIRDGFNILNQPYAVGKQLDCIGEWVGIDRIYNAGQPLYPWFSYIDWNQTTEDTNQGGFQDWDDTIVEDGGFLGWDNLIVGNNKTMLADDLFLSLIKLKIIKNVSTHTMDDLERRLYQYFGDNIYVTWGKDVYNPNAFTIVGTPTITDDGIANGFSSSNYLTNSTIIDTTKSWKAQLTLTTPTLGTSQVVVQLSQYFYLVFSSTKQLSFRTTNNTQTNWVTSTDTLLDNTKYDIEFGWDGTKIFLNYKTSNDSWINKSQTSAAYAGVSNATIESLGFGQSSYPFNGSIDLNAFKIYVDGEEVFSGQKYDGRYLTYHYAQEYNVIMNVAKVKNAVPIPTGMIVKYEAI